MALACFAAHAIRQLIDDCPENLLWTCHVATALVGIGALLRSRDLVAGAALLLTVGLPFWAVDGAMDGGFRVTSIFTHVGGFTLGTIALRRLGGLPQHAWWHAMLIVALLIAISRQTTLPPTNVNFAFEPWKPFAAYVPGGPAHVAWLLAQWGVPLLMARWLVTRLCPTAK